MGCARIHSPAFDNFFGIAGFSFVFLGILFFVVAILVIFFTNLHDKNGFFTHRRINFPKIGKKETLFIAVGRQPTDNGVN
jgi:hypothetical protein